MGSRITSLVVLIPSAWASGICSGFLGLLLEPQAVGAGRKGKSDRKGCGPRSIRGREMKRSTSKARNISRERLERAARIYNSAVAAGLALGINGNTFLRLCREQEILTPAQRRKPVNQL